MKAKPPPAYALILLATLSASCRNQTGEQQQSTVSVSGIGMVAVVPDMIRMTVSLSKTAPTTRLAQEAVGSRAGQVMGILKDSGIETNSISIASLTFSPEYEFRTNGRLLIGQKAQQGIAFPIHGIRDDGGKASQIIDQLIRINGMAQ